MDKISPVTREDMDYIYNKLSREEKDKFNDCQILITGFAGSIGYTLMHFFAIHGVKLGIRKIYAVDNYTFGRPKWLANFEKLDMFTIIKGDVTKDDLTFAQEADYILHLASLASPVFYRAYPIQTIGADVIGLWRLLELYRERNIRGFLFFSSSEVYGDPAPEWIPTKEEYWGNVNPVGPRACYDESKRLGETLCCNYAQQYGMPITIVRPFNNYGPGLRIDDQRVTADFAQAVVQKQPIILYSDGTPTRTFDYIPDAVIGYLKCLLYGQYEVFNIGSDGPELSIGQLAEVFQQIAGEVYHYCPELIYREHSDRHYLTDNPNRRCPNIEKAKTLLRYFPEITVEEGVKRYLLYLKK